MRACELHAIAIQDKVFLDGQFVDPGYKARRENLFLVAVNCGQAGGNCFCASMNTGPKATSGFDLALTELLQDGRHYFLVEVGTVRGAEVLSAVPHQPAEDADKQQAERILDETTRHMGRRLDTRGIKELLYRNYEHPQWDTVTRALPVLRQLHHGLSHLLLHHGGRRYRPDRRARRTLAAMGLVLHGGLLLHSRRKRARHPEIALSPVDDAQTRHLD